MKKYIIPILVLLLIIPSFIQAQEGKAKANLDIPKVQFGINVGPNLGWMKPQTEDYSSEGSVIGFSWGFLTDFNFSNNYGLSSGFNITYNNGKLKYPDIQDSVSGIMQRKYNFQSLEIPIVLKMRTKQMGYITYYGKIGVGTSFNLRAKSKDVFNVEPEEQSDIKNEVTLMRASLLIGGGFMYSLGGNTSLMFEVVFNNGLSNILKGNNSVDPSLEQKAISNYLEFNFGVIF